MPRRYDELPEVGPSYLAYLQKAWRDSSLRPSDIGLSKMTVSRVVRDNATPGLATVWRFYQAFAAARPTLRLAPPAVLIQDAEEYDVLELARSVRSATPHNYVEIVGLLRIYHDAARKDRDIRARLAKKVADTTKEMVTVSPRSDAPEK